MDFFTQTLITAAASSVGALFAAAVGTYLGQRKFRHERSYDARVNWHRELAETVKKLRNRSKSLLYFRERDSAAEEVLEVVNNIGELAFKFQELAEQASLYAKKGTCKAIGQIVKDLNSLTPQFENPPPRKRENDYDEASDPFEISMLGLNLVYDLLARDLRELLGLEKLDEHQNLDFFDNQ
jgi:hypothetical protein